MTIRYIYHSGFLITTGRAKILIDYWTGLGNLNKLTQDEKPLYILASHAHHDHYNPEVLNLTGNVTRIFSFDIPASAAHISLRPGDEFKDDNILIRAYGSTDEGISFVIQADNRLIFHAGDLNNWHWEKESTPQEIQEMESRFLSVCNELAKDFPRFDAIMFPIDPRMETDIERGARQLLARVKTDLLIPMHFGDTCTYKGELGVKTLVPTRNTDYNF